MDGMMKLAKDGNDQVRMPVPWAGKCNTDFVCALTLSDNLSYCTLDPCTCFYCISVSSHFLISHPEDRQVCDRHRFRNCAAGSLTGKKNKTKQNKKNHSVTVDGSC